jgi:lipopolysaccharide/colanic/teichoic acid biosynthesis glycosyltransferase
LAVKRVFDIVGSAIGLIVLSPLLLVTALLIRLRDGSPILFGQTRVGLHGRPFTIYKFRSMVPGAEEHLDDVRHLNERNGVTFKATNDPRVTPTGRWLRRSSIDEVPQLWNVLTGSMSLVGPRPPLPEEVGEYDVWHRRRLSMKPGITGLWQIEARHEPDFDRWVEHDLLYIDGWTLWLDLKILVKTVPALMTHSGR